MLAQTIPADEIIVVDDGSEDETAGVAEKFHRVQVIRQPNRGCAVARNTGIAASSGKWLAFLDADDIWLPEKLALQSDYLKIKFIVSSRLWHDGKLFQSGAGFRAALNSLCHPIDFTSGITAGAMLIRRDTFFQVGEFNPIMRLSQFIE
ncbi:MAG: glycosyltransferase family 2 protein [Desulfobacterales bacterium]|nr:glycosyltransferase family 2 protein [Desulfobacterales bacterium]